MEVAKLEVIISGDVKPLQTALKEGEDSLGKFATEGKESFKPINTGLTTTAATAKTAGTQFKALAAEMKNLALVGLGAGIAAGLNLLKPLIQDIVNEIIHLGEVSEEVTNILNEQTQAFANQQGQLTSELTQIQAYIATARDENLTRQQRNSALKEAQEKYPAYLNSIKLETINSDEARAAINLLTEALVRKAKAEGLAQIISKTYAQIIETQNKPLNENLSLLDKIGIALKSGGNAIEAISDAAVTGAENQQQTLKELQALLDGYVKGLFEVTTEQAKFGDFDKDDKAQKKIKAISLALADLNTNIKDIRFADQIAIETENALAEVQKNLDKGPGLKIPLGFDTTEIAESLNKTLAGLVKSIPQAIDKIFSSITKGNPLGGLFDVIGEALATFGKQMIALAPVIAAIKLAIKTLNPAVLLPAGVALVAIGNLLQNSIPKLAEGGITTGPTLAMVGESGPEAIIPLNQLQTMTSGMSNIQRVEVVGRISGNDIVLIQNRQNVRNGRNYGGNFAG